MQGKKPVKKILGNIVYHKNFYSSFLKNERDIFVWSPVNLENSNGEKFPVLYMHDGQNLVNPKTSFAGFDWRIDETIISLTKQKKIDNIIVVGINNTIDRLEEYSNSPKGELYLKFLIEEVKPFIDKNYPTLTDNKNSAIMGSSMGGLSSFLMVWKHSDVFSKAACLSSSFYYNRFDAIKLIKKTKEKKKIRVYIDHGEDGIDGSQKMFFALTNKGYKIGNELDYFYSPGDGHNEKAWSDRIERPLMFLFGKK